MRGARTTILGMGICVTAAIGACQPPTEVPGTTVPQTCESAVPELAPQRTDILFVIDDSNSMLEEQQAVARELPAFVDRLKEGAGVAVDFRVGVITTGVYEYAPGVLNPPLRENFPAGRLRPVPSTGERFLESTDAALVSKFAELVQQGVSGSGQETPFEAVRLALAGPASTTPLAEGGNAGFLRDGARLLVVVVTDEDDCSETDRPPEVFIGTDTTRNYCREQEANLNSTEEYFQIFRDLRDGNGELRDVQWAAIAPVSRTDKVAQQILDTTVTPNRIRNVDCPTSFAPGFRHRDMASKFDPTLKNLESICNESYREGLLRIAALAVNQTLEVTGVPHERLLRVEITRADNTSQTCTVDNGGIRYEAATAESPGRVIFQEGCLRRADDQTVTLKLVCVG